MSKMGSHDPFGHLQHKLWPKERLGVKLAVWLSTTESQESIRFPCVQVACDTPLESSQQGLHLQFRLHPNRRFAEKVMNPQSCGSPNFSNFRTRTWESRDEKPFKCHSCGEVQSILYGGRWWLPLNSGHGESCESEVARGLS
jgi:hypothetical protein